MSHCYETCRSSLCPYIAQGCLETPTEKQLFAPTIPMSDTILNEPLLMTGAELGEQLSFETLLADVSASFVNLPADQIDDNIENAQRRICECLDIDHASLWQSSQSEPGILLLTHLLGILTYLPRWIEWMGGHTFHRFTGKSEARKLPATKIPRRLHRKQRSTSRPGRLTASSQHSCFRFGLGMVLSSEC